MILMMIIITRCSEGAPQCTVPTPAAQETGFALKTPLLRSFQLGPQQQAHHLPMCANNQWTRDLADGLCRASTTTLLQGSASSSTTGVAEGMGSDSQLQKLAGDDGDGAD